MPKLTQLNVPPAVVRAVRETADAAQVPGADVVAAAFWQFGRLPPEVRRAAVLEYLYRAESRSRANEPGSGVFGAVGRALRSCLGRRV